MLFALPTHQHSIPSPIARLTLSLPATTFVAA
jgi:hypothetical protein